MTNGEEGTGQLFFRYLTQKVTLVFVRIGTGKQMVSDAAIGQSCFRAPAIVARSYIISAQLEGSFQENIKFDFAVAEHIGIGCATGGVFAEHVIDDALAIGFTQVDHLKWNSEVFGYAHGVVAVVDPGAFVADGDGGIMPVAHEHTDHFVPGLFEQPGSYRRIDAATETNHHPGHAAKLPSIWGLYLIIGCDSGPISRQLP